ncbi:PDZ domain-containing protein [Sporolactobacillus sp. THM7-7]|nr:PDZ domain-containing protein [Sporolactobacillus sp. THM7-7]
MKKFSGKVVALLMALSLIVGAAGSFAVFRLTLNRPHVSTPATEVSSAAADSEASKVKVIHDLIERDYYEKVNSDKLYNGAIKGMIEALDDPFSSYMNAKLASEFTQSLSSSFQGIGAEVQMVGDKVSIVSPIKGSPAEKAGLKPNDQIVSIDGKSTEGFDINEAVSKIRGEKGTTVKLGIKRPGVSRELTFSIKRDDIPIRTVESRMIQNGGQSIGYIAITQFNENTDKEFAKALKSLEDRKMNGLVLDVRGNPGGYLQAVEKMANLLVPNKKPIVQIEDREGKKQPFYSTLKTKKDYPVVCLIDEGSASASEILAGALHEGAGYPLVGVKTFGKGTVQQGIELSDRSELKLTTNRWLTPDGNWVHKKGLKPTVSVKQPSYFYVTPPALKKGETLKFDQTGDNVADFQKMLIGAGFDPKRSDGYFSRDTEKAVTSFQQSAKLPATGVIDQKTANELQAMTMKAVGQENNDRQLKAAVQEVKEEIK